MQIDSNIGTRLVDHENGGFTPVDGGGTRLHRDPDRPGTIWMDDIYGVVRTDRTCAFSRSVADFPEVNAIGGTFTGMAADHNGVAWVGSTAQLWNGMGGTLIRINAETGTHQMWQHDLGWPFPGDQVTPLLVMPDGRVWMTYESVYPSTVAGLFAWDGTNVVNFPAPPNGAWQFGGLPNLWILDIEVNTVPNGYELWMSCINASFAIVDPPCTMMCIERNLTDAESPVSILKCLCFHVENLRRTKRAPTVHQRVRNR